MTMIEKFLGQCVDIPDHLHYDIKQGLWAKAVDDTLVFGFTQPAIVLSGGIKDMDPLVDENHKVSRGQSILFVITGKILYLEAPADGVIHFNKPVVDDPSGIAADPYDKGWLFSIKTEQSADQLLEDLASAADYFRSLHNSEGLKNPEGLKGGVSGICKAVYTGIGGQKI
jgi:glycine cleavage system H lipoate-binding protein